MSAGETTGHRLATARYGMAAPPALGMRKKDFAAFRKARRVKLTPYCALTELYVHSCPSNWILGWKLDEEMFG